jgi:phosphoribosylamine--glycine ligase
MENVGVLVVSYGSREAAMVDAFKRSQSYHLELYIADKQPNPFNMQRATKHVVIPDLNLEEIRKFAHAYRDRIDFGIVGPEKPIIEGIRDLIEKSTAIPLICPTKDYALEGSKVAQRLLFEEFLPEANPRFRVFDPKDCANVSEVKQAVFEWVDELQNRAVVKPDKPTAGKGVGVWGDHFSSKEQLLEHFLSNYQYGTVIIEEKIEGEESSFQAFCDGRHLIPLPDTRDYKRAFDGDKGPNTGGMGSYKDVNDTLPFMTENDRAEELQMVNTIFNKWRRKGGDATALRGVPLYVAFMHAGKGPKILENNSRPGDPEIMNILPLLKDDFVDVCYRILEGNLTQVDLSQMASVVTYKVPPTYGGFMETYLGTIAKSEVGSPVDFSKCYKLANEHGNSMRVYPGAVEARGNQTFALKSRTVAVVGLGERIEDARSLSLEGIDAISGGGLWNRTDIASPNHIERSVLRMRELRRAE